MRRLLAATASAALAATLSTTLGATAADARVADSWVTGRQYVAMGDSYSAASGVLPLAPTAPPQCLQSTRNYPHVIAARTGANLTDVTCGAADTNDFYSAQYPGMAPQVAALGTRTKLVTMTIGGNNHSVFSNVIKDCGTEGVLALGQGNPCQRKHGTSYVTTIRTKTHPAIVKALRAVKRRAPHARVAIIGYPWIVPQRVGCFDKLPIARGDVPYLRTIQAELNDAVRRAAAKTGVRYVDMAKVSDGHDACQPIGTRWVEPVMQGTNPVIVHPNALGEQRMAARTMRVMGLL